MQRTKNIQTKTNKQRLFLEKHKHTGITNKTARTKKKQQTHNQTDQIGAQSRIQTTLYHNAQATTRTRKPQKQTTNKGTQQNQQADTRQHNQTNTPKTIRNRQ